MSGPGTLRATRRWPPGRIGGNNWQVFGGFDALSWDTVWGRRRVDQGAISYLFPDCNPVAALQWNSGVFRHPSPDHFKSEAGKFGTDVVNR